MKFLLPRILITSLALAVGIGAASGATSTFTNAAGITINDTSSFTPAAATPYPSAINVAGLAGIITKVTVQLNGVSHTYSDDIDILLVGPDGSQALIMSDTGGNHKAVGVNLKLDDDATDPLPDETALVSGTFKPAAYSPSSDNFPSPAPAPGTSSALSVFKNKSPTGVWSLYVIDDNPGDSGSIDSWALTITTQVPAQAGQVIISEFRLWGPSGGNDEFIEIQNVTDSAHTVQSADGSSGYAVAASDGVIRFVIPNGTVIPARGHYLGVNGTAYSLSSYPAGNGSSATGDAIYSANIPDNAGIAIFRTSNTANFNLTNRLDAAGSTAEVNTLYKEGSGYTALTGYSIDYSLRRNMQNGTTKDTGNNAVDFVFADTNGTFETMGQRLGAPGPENLSSPIRLLSGASLIRNLVDPGVALGASPNRIRTTLSDPANNATFGNVQFTRQFTNSTAGNLNRLRFRIVDLTTFPSPSGVADLRPGTMGDSAVSLSGGGSALVRGAALEQPPTQLNGGGLNSTFSALNVTANSPLASGASINVGFRFGIQQVGTYRFAIIPETLPAAGSAVWIVSGSTEDASLEVETVQLPTIGNVTRPLPDVKFSTFYPVGLPYQLQFSTDLVNWTDLGAPVTGTGGNFSVTHNSGGSPPKQFYRIKQLP